MRGFDDLFETAPGWQGQFDFAEVKLPWGKRYAVLVVLGYSRKLYVEFVPRQTALTVVHSLERAFADFGGVPAEMLFDQLKAVIVEEQQPGGGLLLENVAFGRFAARAPRIAHEPVPNVASRHLASAV